MLGKVRRVRRRSCPLSANLYGARTKVEHGVVVRPVSRKCHRSQLLGLVLTLPSQSLYLPGYIHPSHRAPSSTCLTVCLRLAVCRALGVVLPAALPSRAFERAGGSLPRYHLGCCQLATPAPTTINRPGSNHVLAPRS